MTFTSFTSVDNQIKFWNYQ